MTLLSGLGSASKRSPGSLLPSAAVSFVSALLTCSLVSLLNCHCPPHAQILQQAARAGHGDLQVSKVAPTVVDWINSDFGRFMNQCAPPVSLERIRPVLLENVYKGVSPYTDFPPQFAKPYLQTKYIQGWGSTGSVFKRLLEEVRPKIVLEMGSFLGASAIHMATLAQTMFDHQVLILCADDFRLWPTYQDQFNVHRINGDVQALYQFLQNAQTMNVSDYILPLPFSVTHSLNALCGWGITADLIEVDANHDFHSVWSDINLAYALLRPGGTLFGHDYHLEYDDRGVKRAVEAFAELKGFSVEVDGQHWILRGS